MSTIEESYDLGWHKNAEYLELLRSYHDKYARQPDMKEARSIHSQLMNTFETAFKKENLCKRIIYAGSAYDGLKVGRSSEPDGIDDLEFDAMLVIGVDMVSKDNYTSNNSVMAKLRPLEEYKQATTLNETIDGEFICPKKLVSTYMSKLQKIVNNIEEIQFPDGKPVSIKLKNHGPAIQLDVMKDNKVNPSIFSIDVVPTFQITDQDGQFEYFVAKPGPTDDEKFNFRKSFSVQEKELLNKIDSDNGCRKKMTRVLKVIFKREPTLKVFSSYTIKSTMLHLIKEKNDSNDWQEEKSFDRFIDFFKLLHKFVSNKQMPHYFLDSEQMPIKPNEISCAALGNVRCRINNVLTSEKVMKKILRA